jgi:hypothetical protein
MDRGALFIVGETRSLLIIPAQTYTIKGQTVVQNRPDRLIIHPSLEQAGVLAICNHQMTELNQLSTRGPMKLNLPVGQPARRTTSLLIIKVMFTEITTENGKEIMVKTGALLNQRFNRVNLQNNPSHRKEFHHRNLFNNPGRKNEFLNLSLYNRFEAVDLTARNLKIKIQPGNGVLKT